MCSFVKMAAVQSVGIFTKSVVFRMKIRYLLGLPNPDPLPCTIPCSMYHTDLDLDPEPVSVNFGMDPDPRIRTCDKQIRMWIRIQMRILLFSPKTFKTPTKNKFLCIFLF
jgi:hypothetical protein